MQTVTVTVGGDKMTLGLDLANAAAPIVINGTPSQYRTADARHDLDAAVELAVKDQFGSEVDMDAVEVVRS
jgi:hypothetical protein